MPLGRKEVDETSGKHIRHILERNPRMSEKQKQEIRQLHEKCARQAQANTDRARRG